MCLTHPFSVIFTITQTPHKMAADYLCSKSILMQLVSQNTPNEFLNAFLSQSGFAESWKFLRIMPPVVIHFCRAMSKDFQSFTMIYNMTMKFHYNSHNKVK